MAKRRLLQIRETELEKLAILELPVLPVRDTVLFPHMMAPLIVGRAHSIRAIEEALASERSIIVVAQKVLEMTEIEPDNLYNVGTEAVIGRILRLPDGTTSVLVQGQQRVRILEFVEGGPYLQARALPIPEPTDKPKPVEALIREVLSSFEKVVQLSRHLGNDAYVAALNIDEPGWLADFIISSLELPVAQRQEILEALDPATRLQKVGIILAKQLDIMELESQIHTQVQQQVDKSQREYFLREQLKQIQKELGETDAQARQYNELKAKIEAAAMPEGANTKAMEELERLSQQPPMSPEVGMIRTYLDWLIALPWAQATEDNLDIKRAAVVLDENHYGLPKVKERILEYMAVRKLAAEKLRSPILCFVGPPGVGKTSLGRSIAQALGRKFVRISLGGIRDEAEIRGHRRTYIGSLPGRIIQTMRTAGTINPVFMMDEIDKVGIDFRGDPSAALLEVLDPEQNCAFSDHYLDVPYNLSKVLFITTANVTESILSALRDRMEVIELPGYIEEEKLQIARHFLVPKQVAEHGLQPKQLRFVDGALRRIIREYTHEAGLRNLEREIANICRKVAKKVAEDGKAPTVVSTEAIPRYLGPQKFFWGTAEEYDEVGVATGVAWTEAGGDTMTIEVTLMEGKGNLLLTGQLGDVMKESAQAALSYIRSRARQFDIDPKRFEQTDIHIHVPAGAIPKDGPSAGITMATALTSAFTRRPVRRDLAMTGEITLRGRVLPVGGLREKVLAAHRAGIKTFVMPKKNIKDLTEVPADVQRALNFVYVERMDEVLPVALLEADKRPQT
jgi:ATP-dependent Lon protease